MVKGTKKTNLTIEEILNKVSDYEIYRYYVGHDFVIGKTFCSPFRKESDPSFVIAVSKSDRLKHLDYGDASKRGDCVDFVCQLYLGMSYDRALKLIARDLGITNSPEGNKERSVVEGKERKEKLIQVVARKFDTADLQYWADYHISEKELKSNDVYAVKKLYVDRERIMIPSTELTFGYLMEDKWKIYRPFADKKHKWLSNVPYNYISGLDRIINNCEKGVITKAKKDEMVLAKFLPNVASVQGESEISISKENIDLIVSTCKQTYLNFDSDEVGVQACKYYNQFGFKWVNCPKGYYTPQGKVIKDFADLAKYHGLDIVINHFKQKGII
jgi:hypothetical protein